MHTQEDISLSDKEKALDLALAQIERSHGKGAIMRLGDNVAMAVESIPTGSIALDIALGIGGIPRGRVTEIYGHESGGKTTLALHIVAEAQKLGGTAAYIDAEHALDPLYAERLGVNAKDLLISQPDTGEQALDICELLVRSGAIDIVVIDSVAALVSRAEIEGEMGDSHPGMQARLMSQALRKLTAAISRSKTSVVFINQIREKIGVMFGNPEVTPGGRALKFYSSVRLDVRRVDSIKQGTDVVGNRVRVKVVKNKVAPPFKQVEFDHMYAEGISREGGLLDVGLEMGLVDKSGAWFNVRLSPTRTGSRERQGILASEPGHSRRTGHVRFAKASRSSSRKRRPSRRCRGDSPSSHGRLSAERRLLFVPAPANRSALFPCYHPTMLQPDTLLNDRYRLVALIGEGGMAAVYRAVDTRLGRDVAVKVLHPEYARDQPFVQRFQQEAEFAASLGAHPNIVAIYDIGQDDGLHYIVMELVEGRDLKDIIRERAPLEVAEAFGIARQVASALAFAHQRGLVHRDVKPQNIMVTDAGSAKVTDFGIARSLSASQLTRTGMVIGTAHYFAPEQAQGKPGGAFVRYLFARRCALRNAYRSPPF